MALTRAQIDAELSQSTPAAPTRPLSAWQIDEELRREAEIASGPALPEGHDWAKSAGAEIARRRAAAAAGNSAPFTKQDELAAMERWQTLAQGPLNAATHATGDQGFAGQTAQFGQSIGQGAASTGLAALNALPQTPTSQEQLLAGQRAIQQDWATDDTVANAIGQGVGSAIPFVAASMLGGPLAGGGTLGAVVGGGANRQEVAARRQRGEQISAGQEAAMTAAGAITEAGTEAASAFLTGGLGRVLGTTARKLLQRPVVRAGAALVGDMAVNAAEEASAQVLQNASTKAILNENLPTLTEGVGRAALGGIGGGMVSLANTGQQYRKARQEIHRQAIAKKLGYGQLPGMEQYTPQELGDMVMVPGDLKGSYGLATRFVAEAKGKDVMFYYDPHTPINAFNSEDGKTVYVNAADPGRGLLGLVVHDTFGHGAEGLKTLQNDPRVQEEYDRLKADYPDLFEQAKEYVRLVHGRIAPDSLVMTDDAALEEEAVAHLMQTAIETSQGTVDAFAAEYPKLWRRIARGIAETIDKVTGGSMQRGRLVQQQLGVYAEIERNLAGAERELGTRLENLRDITREQTRLQVEAEQAAMDEQDQQQQTAKDIDAEEAAIDERDRTVQDSQTVQPTPAPAPAPTAPAAEAQQPQPTAVAPPVQETPIIPQTPPPQESPTPPQNQPVPNRPNRPTAEAEDWSIDDLSTNDLRRMAPRFGVNPENLTRQELLEKLHAFQGARGDAIQEDEIGPAQDVGEEEKASESADGFFPEKPPVPLPPAPAQPEEVSTKPPQRQRNPRPRGQKPGSVDVGAVDAPATPPVSTPVSTPTPQEQQQPQLKPEQPGLNQEQPQAPAPPAPTPQTPPAAPTADPEKSPALRMAESLLAYLASQPKLTQSHLTEAANNAFGKEAVANMPRAQLQEIMELALNLAVARHMNVNPAAPLDVARNNIAAIESILDKSPTQTWRDDEKTKYQQFSTPPHYAYAAAWVANLNSQDTVLEPSAGTGSLAVHGLIVGANTVANELSARRGALLQDLGVQKVYRENAEQISKILNGKVAPTVVLMNPPFSQTAGRMGDKKVLMTGANHITECLKLLPPGGRLVAIVGRGMTFDAPTYRDWWLNIAANYQIQANVGVSGDVYRKYGTSFATRLLVIDNTGKPTTGNPVVGDADSVVELMQRLEGVRNARSASQTAEQPQRPSGPQQAQDQPGVPAETPGTGRGSRPENPAPDLNGPMGIREPGDSGQQPALPPGAGTSSPVTPSAESGPDSVLPGSQTGRGKRGRPGNAGTQESSQERDGRPGDAAVSPVETNRPEAEKTQAPQLPAEEDDPTKAKVQDSIFEPYRPQKVTIPGAQKHPTKLVESAAMSLVEPPDADYKPHIPKAIIDSGRLSAAQLEAIIYAGRAHQFFIQTEHGRVRRGFFIGDGTGVGKGAEGAGIILDNWNQGRKKAVWVSKNFDLQSSAQRDWEWVGRKAGEIVGQNKYAQAESIDAKEGILFTAYGTLRQKEKMKGGQKIKSRVEQIVEWAGGKDFDGVILFDESHMMKSGMPVEGERGTASGSDTALAGIELMKALPNARIVYLSATGATEVMNLAYATRLGLWGHGTAFDTAQAFVSQMEDGGIATMELIARDMKQMGMYMARQLSYDGCGQERLTHVLNDDQRALYDKVSEAFQTLVRRMEQALEITASDDYGEIAKDARREPFKQLWSMQNRFYNQFLSTLQMPTILADMEKELAAGNSAVLQLVNTNAASEDRAIASMKEDDELENLDLSPKDQILRMVQDHFPVEQYEQYEDESGNVRWRIAKDSEGRPVLNPEAVAMRDRLLMELASLKLPVSPIQMILDRFGPDAVAEVTGRNQRIIRRVVDGAETLVRENRTPASRMADIGHFQDGKKRILVFSGAGGTGGSYHADEKAKNQQRRIHYLVQAGWQAEAAVQGFGRTHRAGEVNQPLYKLCETNINGHKRFIATIARRLDQLGALTRGQRQAGSQNMFSELDNLESKYANNALRDLMGAIGRNQIEGWDSVSFRRMTGLEASYTKPPRMSQFLNRLLIVPMKEQNRLFDELMNRFATNLRVAKRTGQLDVGVETLKADKIRKLSEKTIYVEPTTKSETKLVKLEASRKTVKLTFDQLDSIEGVIFVENAISGKVHALLEGIDRTNSKTGVVEPTYRLTGVTTGFYISKAELDSNENYIRIDRDRAGKMWSEQYRKAPDHSLDEMNLVTGLLLPIWDKIKGSSEVRRAKLDTGQEILGRVMDDEDLDTTLANLGHKSEAADMTPESAFASVTNKGKKAVLANEWELARKSINGVERIEIKGPDYRYFERLSSMGVIVEQHNWDRRFFLPAGDSALGVFKKVLEISPLQRLAKGKRTDSSAYSLSYDKAVARDIPGLDSRVRDLRGELAAYSDAERKQFTFGWLDNKDRDNDGYRVYLIDKSKAGTKLDDDGMIRADERTRAMIRNSNLDGVRSWFGVAKSTRPNEGAWRPAYEATQRLMQALRKIQGTDATAYSLSYDKASQIGDEDLARNSGNTAMNRGDSPSVPVRMLKARGLIAGRVLHQGAGLASNPDRELINQSAAEAVHYDPNHSPETFDKLHKRDFDTIVTPFVLNTLTPRIRKFVLDDAASSLKPGGNAYFAVRGVGDVPTEGKPNWVKREDGWLVPNKGEVNFQRGFAAADLEKELSSHFGQVEIIKDTKTVVLAKAAKPRTDTTAYSLSYDKALRFPLPEPPMHYAARVATGQIDMSGSVREAKALRAVMQAQAKASRAGWKTAINTSSGIRRELVRIIQETLPESAAGQLLNDVAKANDLAGLRVGVERLRLALANFNVTNALNAMENFTGRLQIEVARPEPVAADPEDEEEEKPKKPRPKTVRKLEIEKMGEPYRSDARALLDEARAAKKQAQDARSIEEKYAAIEAAAEILKKLKEIAAANLAERELRVADRLRTREEVVGELVKAINAEPLPAGTAERPKDASLARRILGRGSLSMDSLATLIAGEKSDTFGITIDAVRKAQRRFYEEQRRFDAHLSESLKRAGYAPGSKAVDGFLNTVEDWELPDAGTIRMTRNQAVGLYAAFGDPQTLELIQRGIGWTFKANPLAAPVTLSLNDFSAVIEELTDGEKEMVEAFKAYNRTRITAPLMDAALDLKGSAPETHEGYFPRRRNRQQDQRSQLPQGWRDHFNQAMENISSLEERQQSKRDPLFVPEFIQDATHYVEDAAKVIHLAATVRNAAMVWEDPRTRAALQSKYGESMINRTRQFLADTMMVRQRTPDSGLGKWAGAVSRNIARAWLQLNPSPMAKNILGGTVSLLPEFESQDWIAGVKGMFSPEAYKRMLEASSIIWQRYNGGLYGQYSPLTDRHVETVAQLHFADAIKTGKVGQVIDAIPLMAWADSIPLRAAFVAAEHYVNRTMPDATPAARKAATLAKFEQALYRTQNGSSSTEISGIASAARQNPLAQPFLMFTSDQSKKYNMLARMAAAGQERRSQVLLAVGLNSLMAAGIGGAISKIIAEAGRAAGGGVEPEDEDQEIKESIAWNTVKNLAGVAYFGDRLVEVARAISTGRGNTSVASPAGEALSTITGDLVRLGTNMYRWSSAEDPDKAEKAYEAILKSFNRLLVSGSTMAGNPLVPLIRYAQRGTAAGSYGEDDYLADAANKARRAATTERELREVGQDERADRFAAEHRKEIDFARYATGTQRRINEEGGDAEAAARQFNEAWRSGELPKAWALINELGQLERKVDGFNEAKRLLQNPSRRDQAIEALRANRLTPAEQARLARLRKLKAAIDALSRHVQAGRIDRERGQQAAERVAALAN